MKIRTIQTITRILDENGLLLKSTTVESYSVTADEGKYLRNKFTGEIYNSGVCFGNRTRLGDLEELEIKTEGR